MVGKQAMSEFKFACPVCGQHITADSATSGGELECPTCFRKIVVPQAPATPDTKLILSAAQVESRRASALEAMPKKPNRHRSPSLLVRIPILMLVLILASAAAWFMRDHVFHLFQSD